jgi:hypothetical protein
MSEVGRDVECNQAPACNGGGFFMGAAHFGRQARALSPNDEL